MTGRSTETKNKFFSRDITAKDLGIKGDLTQLRGTLSVKDGVYTASIDMIEGKITNPTGIVKNISNVSRSYGATTLRVEGTIANDRLYGALQGRYGLVSEGAKDSFTINLR